MKKISAYIPILIVVVFALLRYKGNVIQDVKAWYQDRPYQKEIDACIKAIKNPIGFNKLLCTMKTVGEIQDTDPVRALRLCVKNYITPTITDNDRTYAETQCDIQMKVLAATNKQKKINEENNSVIIPELNATLKGHTGYSIKKMDPRESQSRGAVVSYRFSPPESAKDIIALDVSLFVRDNATEVTDKEYSKRTFKVDGDEGYIREYIGYRGNYKVIFNVWMKLETQATQADELFDSISLE